LNFIKQNWYILIILIIFIIGLFISIIEKSSLDIVFAVSGILVIISQWKEGC
jgi:hypothetical protein